MRKSKKDAMDRRKFLQGAAAGAAALAAIPAAAEPRPSDAPRAATAQPMPREPEIATPAEVDVLDRNALRVRLHGGRAQVAGHRIRRGESRIELSRPARIGDQLRRQSESGVHHLLPRRIGGRHGARLRQDRGQAAWRCFCTATSACSTHRWRFTTRIAIACRLYLIAGNTLDIASRRPGVEWDHSVQDAAAMVRDCLKWDDVPMSLEHFAESAVRAYKIAMTPPMAPVLLVADGELQERPIPDDSQVSHSEADAGRRRRRAIPARWPKRRACWSRRKIR